MIPQLLPSLLPQTDDGIGNNRDDFGRGFRSGIQWNATGRGIVGTWLQGLTDENRLVIGKRYA